MWKKPEKYTLNKQNSGVKTWKLTLNFPNRKSFWYVKGMNILSEKIPGYKLSSVRNRVFMTSQRLNMAELATIMYLVKHMPKKVGL